MSATNVTLNVTNVTSIDNTPVKNYQDFLKTDILKYACEKIAEKTTDGKLIITHSNEPQSDLITNLALDSLHIFCKLMQMKTTKLNGPAIAGIADNVPNDLLKNPAKLNELKQFLVRKKICLLFEKSILGEKSLKKITIDPSLKKTLDDFLKSSNRLLVVHGLAGCGKTVSLRLFLKSFLGKMSHWTPIYFHLKKDDEEFKTLSEMKKVYLVDDTPSDEVGSFLIVVDGYDELTDWEDIDTHLKCNEWPNSKFIVLCRSFVINTEKTDSKFVITDQKTKITDIKSLQIDKSYLQLKKLVEKRIEVDEERNDSLRQDIEWDEYSKYAFEMFNNKKESKSIENSVSVENSVQNQNKFCSMGLFTRDWDKVGGLWICFIDSLLIHYFVTEELFESLVENKDIKHNFTHKQICDEKELKRLLIERCQNDFQTIQCKLRHNIMLKIKKNEKSLICFYLNIWAQAFFSYTDNQPLNEETEPYAFSLYQTVFVAYQYEIPFSPDLCKQLNKLGKKYLDKGDHFDAMNARQLFTMSGSNGNRSAAEELGNMYRDGIAVKGMVDITKALDWYKRGNKVVDDEVSGLNKCKNKTVKTTIEFQNKLASNVVILRQNELSDFVQNDHIEQVVTNFPKLRKLTLDGCTQITNHGLESLSKHPLKHLVKLHITNCLLVDDDGIKVIKILTSLRKLNLTGCNITKKGLDIVFEHKQLTNLSLGSMTTLKKHDFDYVSKLRNLQLLNINGCTSLKSFKPFTKLINLRILCIGNMNCGKMLNTLQKFTSLRELHIFNETMDDTNLQSISSIDQLISLRLVDCSGPISSLECLAQLTSLRVLYLSNFNALNDELIKKLTKLIKLRVLKLSNCAQLTDKSLQLISNFTYLQDLELMDSKDFTEKGIKSLHSLKTLERSNL